MHIYYPTRALERLVNIEPIELHLRHKAASTIARIHDSVNKANWDGIGINNKRGHLFNWTKYLGNLKPIQNSSMYNFKHFIMFPLKQFLKLTTYKFSQMGQKAKAK